MGTAAPPTVGIIANPHAGKDIRRLVAHASPTSDAAKIGIIRRAVVGAVEGGAQRLLLAPDKHNLAERAVTDLDLPETVRIQVLDEPVEGRSTDTIAMAVRMAKEHVGAVIVLGGDGTNRDVAKGWLDVPIMPISTGTNNVFPRLVEATLAGLAAGLVASGAVSRAEAGDVADVIHVSVDDGDDDLALVDLALLAARFTGSRAVWHPDTLRALVACIAEPASVGLSSIPALLAPLARTDPGGVLVRFVAPGEQSGTVPAPHRTVRAPVAPGMFADVHWSWCEHLPEGRSIDLTGPGVLSFDGERDRVLAAGTVAHVVVRRDGPFVIDPRRAIAAAGARRSFDRPNLDRN